MVLESAIESKQSQLLLESVQKNGWSATKVEADVLQAIGLEDSSSRALVAIVPLEKAFNSEMAPTRSLLWTDMDNVGNHAVIQEVDPAGNTQSRILVEEDAVKIETETIGTASSDTLSETDISPDEDMPRWLPLCLRGVYRPELDPPGRDRPRLWCLCTYGVQLQLQVCRCVSLHSWSRDHAGDGRRKLLGL